MKSQSIRLQKYIADCGVTSRRKAEDLIVQGRVKVNDKVVKELGTKVSLEGDVVMVDGEMIDLLSVDHIAVFDYGAIFHHIFRKTFALIDTLKLHFKQISICASFYVVLTAEESFQLNQTTVKEATT